MHHPTPSSECERAYALVIQQRHTHIHTQKRSLHRRSIEARFIRRWFTTNTYIYKKEIHEAMIIVYDAHLWLVRVARRRGEACTYDGHWRCSSSDIVVTRINL